MITFVIPAHNEERLLAGTLGALHAASRSVNEPYEIIVADDGSTDATGEVATRHGARVVRLTRRQIAAARNAGAAQGRGDLLIFVDADTEVPGSVLRAAVDAIRAGAVGGGARACFDGRVPFYGSALMKLWLWLQRSAHLASGCFIFCSREAFQTVGGFDESLYIAEDVELSKRLKRLGRFVIVREMVVTSGRKVRTHSGAELLRILGDFLLQGNGFFRKRQAHWYGPRRDDSDHSA